MQNYLFIGQIYSGDVIRLQNIESGEPETHNIGDKLQDKNDFILHNDIINSRGNQIIDMIQEFEIPPMW